MMEKLIWFAILSLPVIAASLRSLKKVRSHGFYRFFAWEGMLWLAINNFPFWFKEPLSGLQIGSWILLVLAVYPALSGIWFLIKNGKANNERKEEHLFAFEKTTELVDTGIYKFIRHPLYGSLILLTWGIFLKNPTLILSVVSVISTVLLFLTAKFDEKECIAYFGEKYTEYKKRSKMFIPFLF